MSNKSKDIIINKVIEYSVEILGDEVISIYGMGSLGYNGFVENWSDYDIDIILHEDSSKNIIKIMDSIEGKLNEDGLKNIDVKCYKLSTLNDSNQNIYTYGLTNRALMILNSATLYFGKDIRKDVKIPRLKDIKSETWKVVNNLLSKDQNWWLSRPIDDTAAILSLPARLIYTLEKEDVTDKSTAIDYYFKHYSEIIPQELWIWIIWAKSCRYFPEARFIPSAPLKEAIEASRNQLIFLRNKFGE